MSVKLNWMPEGYYLLRMPVMPVNTINELLIDPVRSLASLWATSGLSEAIYVASAGLHVQIEQHLAVKGWPLPAPLQRALLKYALRMSTRATPFGLMAGCATGYVGDSTQIRLPPITNRQQRHVRLDMELVAQLVKQLTDYPTIRQQLRFFTNNSLYAAGHEIRYVDRDATTPERHYFISAVERATYLQTVLDLAQPGATFQQMVAATAAAGVDPETAQEFILQLIEQRLLLSELEPALTGPTPLAVLRVKLASLTGTAPLVDTLQQIEQQLTSNQSAQTIQQHVADKLRQHIGLEPEQHLTQTDLFINTSANQLHHRVVGQILAQLAELWPLNRVSAPDALQTFARQFRQRYDQREIPLSEALDGDVGIGYGDTANNQTAYTPLLTGLQFPSINQVTTVPWGAKEELLLKKMGQGLQQKGQAVGLSPAEIATLAPGEPAAKTNRLANSFYVLGTLLGTSEADVDAGHFQFSVQLAAGPSAASLLGRFCAHSPELTDLVRASLQREEAQYPDRLYAEIIHWPNNRAGNVLVRPQLRAYEIPYNSPASVDDAHQLPLSDLVVSVRSDDSVRLRSKRLNREVIPRLSTAHNYRQGLPAYQFLADLQFQHERLLLGWDWGPLKNQPYLPRITYKQLILSRATWSLPVAELPTHSAESLAHYLRQEQHMPRWVSLSQGDNELLIDLDAPVTQQLLLDETNRLTTLKLTEWLATPDQCWLQNGTDRYVQELIIPGTFPSTRPLATVHQPAAGMSVSAESNVPTRSFPPGSEWLYVKVYAGVYSADELLKVAIEPFWRELMADKLIDQYFFIRYFDPDFHLRLRMHGTAPGFVGTALTRLTECLAPHQQAGVVYRVQVDTYEREVERYGPATLLQSEQLFWADSEAVLTYLATEADPDDRWLFALQSSDALLTDFGLDTDQKVSLAQQLQAHFLAEHQADQALRKQLNERYRAEQARIFQHLSALPDCLQTRSVALSPIVQQIRANYLTQPQAVLLTSLGSYLHMAMNRIFTAKHRAQEMVIYHFLARHYESQRARLSATARIQSTR